MITCNDHSHPYADSWQKVTFDELNPDSGFRIPDSGFWLPTRPRACLGRVAMNYAITPNSCLLSNVFGL